ncbi:hypothetical protein BDW02DRAFT_574763 [Decorospora gaudefroyi]|uniref:Uncharacterized protein n=1 Tax=Decorospora gaudefroyi TaxID=184978 RepID=A0A6A5K574_9PLEO|nr:hypothetical protein BDW02DRAFT_574763 [Decorospora gaudefroyi]
MLLDMLTADAAAKHGHEYSPPPAASPTNHGTSLLAMPLSLLGSVLRGQTPSPSQATTTSHQVESTLPTPNIPTPQRDEMKIPHDEPIISLTRSRPTSSSSDATEEKLRKRNHRAKTSYNIARPVNARSKLHIRPKVLLQLHQRIASQRPKPAYDVIPFSLLPPRSTRRLSHTFNTRERLGPHALLIVKAETYTSRDEEGRSDEDRWGSRDVIGVISPGKCERGVSGATEICLNDGMSRWEVTDMPNGSYEFNSTDEHGLALKARWVLKAAHARRVSSMSTGSTPTAAPGPEDKKFTFSTISPNSRRHPIIATMTRNRIDVMDTYAMPSATSPPTPSFSSYNHSPTTTPSTIDLDSFIDNLSERLPIETDDALRRFILVSGVWVASKEFPAETLSQPLTPTPTASATFRAPNHRTVSMSVLDAPRSPSPASTLDENRRSLPRMFKPSLERLPRHTSSTDAPASPASTKTTANASPVVKTRSRRANSTGTALHSMSGSIRKKYGLAFEDETLVESVEERQLKRSVELLRIKELALPSPVERPSAETCRTPPTTTASPIVIPPFSEDPNSSAPLPSPPLLSPQVPGPERRRKTQSAYAPITTTGMWDSGVTEGPGVKKRPTSMFVMNEKKRKQERKSERSKSKESKDSKAKPSENSSEGMGLKRKGDWYVYKLKLRLKDVFKRDKA